MACTKVGYKDKKQADHALKTINNARDNRQIKPSRCYYCTNCKHYHLTHNIMFDRGADFLLKFKEQWEKLMK